MTHYVKPPAFNPEDVAKVAQALLEYSTDHDITYGMNSYNECRHCSSKVDWREPADDIIHDSECPVLIARDLLAGTRP